jgi:indoleamine 2,3-dioxygenase
MEYAGSYALFNYRLADASRGLEYSNLRLIRAFELGLDPKSSEAGFVLVHVAMVQHSGKLVSGAMDALDGCMALDREAFDCGLEKVVHAMRSVNRTMNSRCHHRRDEENLGHLWLRHAAKGMWARSKPSGYTSFRTFIFGITSQSMFPNGVTYEGVSGEPMHFRGESGANDSMVGGSSSTSLHFSFFRFWAWNQDAWPAAPQIPLCDNLLQIEMPDTPLTEILKDFRSYRPGNHREFLEWVRDRALDAGVREYALQDKGSAALYLQALNEVRDFRWRHWCFTREYILKNTAHPTATGGSPIVTVSTGGPLSIPPKPLFSSRRRLAGWLLMPGRQWLPNQLEAVLAQMCAAAAYCGMMPSLGDIMDTVHSQQKTLRKEVDKYCSERQTVV